MFTNENETLVTLIGALVIVVITIFQFLAMSRAKSSHHKKILELGNTLRTNKNQDFACITEKCSLFSYPCHLLQIIFGILVFVAFTWWALYLVSVGASHWAPLSGYVALIGLMTPIIAWRGYSHRHHVMHEKIKNLKMESSFTTENDQTTINRAAQTLVSQTISEPEPLAVTDPKPVVIEEPIEIVKPEPVQAPKVVAPLVTIKENTEISRAKSIVIEKQKLPQDSILRRHFLTNLRTQIESAYPVRPNDSILKRHYESFVCTEVEKYVEGRIESEIMSSSCAESCSKTVETIVLSAAAIGATSEAAQIRKQDASDDSNRKHSYLSPLQMAIESGMLPRPTDSILKRHYDHLVVSSQQGV